MTHRRPQGIPWWFLMLLGPSAHAAAGCDEPLVGTVRSAHALVASWFSDTRRGEPSPADMKWLRRRFELIDAACQRGGDVEAAWRVEAVLERLEKRAGPLSRLTGGSHRGPGVVTDGGSVAATPVDGSRPVNAEPSASRLTTSMVPP